MARPVVLHHPASQLHDTGPHPERVERILAIERQLGEREGWLGWEARESPEVTREQVQRVHPERYVNGIQELCAMGGGHIDADTLVVEGSWDAALRGAGGAVALVDALLGEGAPTGASLHRPPGHHAERTHAMGFCLLSNAAIAARHAQAAHGVERVLVVDWDVHHGNGTQDVFYDDDSVLFVSVHESPLYPGTGAAGDTGRAAGEGHTVNVPVPGRSGDDVFCSVVEHVAVPLARAFEPGLVLISAGFDAHERDPLATCACTDEGFGAMGASLARVAAELGVPAGLVLEGGYDLQGLVGGLRAAMGALAAGGADAPSLPVHRLAAAARERHARRWPALAA